VICALWCRPPMKFPAIARAYATLAETLRFASRVLRRGAALKAAPLPPGARSAGTVPGSRCDYQAAQCAARSDRLARSGACTDLARAGPWVRPARAESPVGSRGIRWGRFGGGAERCGYNRLDLLRPPEAAWSTPPVAASAASRINVNKPARATRGATRFRRARGREGASPRADREVPGNGLVA
jgi:hypothetical protein